ncbi:hypothetical protein CMQ_8173 [Grosmannia clavigera kw1407]|uniref:Heterokaryon incompatibility domain-containing protein n=1 Tax=Grosmannia clavigera (strain kw1407 / UAMH 11150) TaxID=655863 RepID=F0XKQ1_GROCL|nr:uncharacterized protein CMQ_8173 [Grosmannia clavigera kw1407]EFX01707.1 hypothetical protein CMQ_8173 [Grosmannia clavigera kw1407]
MEHLSPVGASHINIPYLGTEWFEAGCLRDCSELENFKGYLHRKNWVLDRTTARLVFGNRGPDEIAEFLQTAFYFGCLISVFRTVQIPIQTSDFLENCSKTGKIFVRTTRLQALIGAWIAFEESAPTMKTSSKFDREQTISEMLNYTSYFLTLFSEKSQDMSEPHKSQMHLIELSIMALGSLVNKLYKEPHRSSNHDMLPATIHQSDDDDDDNDMVPFWIDTLCVPSWDKDLRRKAIENMGNICRRADRVLVLDAHLLCLPRSADIVESLYFQLADGAESFYDTNYVELQRFDPRLPEILCSPLRSLCARELEAFYRYDEGKAAYRGSGSEGDGDGDDLPARMRSCAKYLGSRHTSRSADEPLCVATILGLNPGKLLETSDRVKRMARFYDLVGLFDPRIIFHEHPRLPEEGHRWAPSFFLQQTPDIITLRENSFLDLPPVSIIPLGGGLPVQLAGFDISGLPETATLCQAGRSPIYFRPETPVPVPLQQWSWAQKTVWFSCAYTLELLPDADGKMPNIGDCSKKKEQYAAILPGFLHPDYLPAIGVLGLIVADGNGTREESKLNKKDWTKGSGRPGNQISAHLVPWRISVDYVCRVRVSLPPAEAIPQDMSFVTGKAFGWDQSWCIR